MHSQSLGAFGRCITRGSSTAPDDKQLGHKAASSTAQDRGERVPRQLQARGLGKHYSWASLAACASTAVYSISDNLGYGPGRILRQDTGFAPLEDLRARGFDRLGLFVTRRIHPQQVHAHVWGVRKACQMWGPCHSCDQKRFGCDKASPQNDPVERAENASRDSACMLYYTNWEDKRKTEKRDSPVLLNEQIEELCQLCKRRPCQK